LSRCISDARSKECQVVGRAVRVTVSVMMNNDYRDMRALQASFYRERILDLTASQIRLERARKVLSICGHLMQFLLH